MKKWKALSVLCVVTFTALASQAFALSPNAFMVSRNFPNEIRIMAPNVATLIPQSGPLKETLNSLDSDGTFNSIWPIVTTTIQNFSFLTQAPADRAIAGNEDVMAAALLVAGATPDALINRLADKDTKKDFVLEDPVEGLTAHSAFKIGFDDMYAALYQSGDETFLLLSSSPRSFNEMARQSKEPLKESFVLQGPLHLTLSLNSKDFSDELAQVVEKIGFEITLAMTEQKATLLSWVDPAVWKNYLTFEPLPVDPKELTTVPLFGFRRVATVLSTQLPWIPKDITPQQLLSFLPPEEIQETLDGLGMFGISGEMIIAMLRNPLTFTLGDMVESPLEPMLSMLLHASDVPEQLINQLPVYGAMLSMAFKGEKEDQKPAEFALPDSSWKGYVVKKPSPFLFATSADRNLLSGTAPVEVLTTEATVHPSIKTFMETPHVFALAVDVQATLVSAQALIFMSQEDKNALSRLDVITAFSDGDSTVTAEIIFK